MLDRAKISRHSFWDKEFTAIFFLKKLARG
jgi:hypothetical protein